MTIDIPESVCIVDLSYTLISRQEDLMSNVPILIEAPLY